MTLQPSDPAEALRKQREWRLCYVREPWAYFTTQAVQDQWGDDWNDAPYEHNAEDPYGPCWHREPQHRKENEPLCPCHMCERDWDGTEPRWEIMRVAYEGPLDAPCDGHFNSPWSVQDINSGKVAWLRTSEWAPEGVPSIEISAGTPLEDFKDAVATVGGRVYTPEATS